MIEMNKKDIFSFKYILDPSALELLKIFLSIYWFKDRGISIHQ